MKYAKGLSGFTKWKIVALDEDDNLLPYFVSFREKPSHEKGPFQESASIWLSEKSMDDLVESTKKIESMNKPSIKRGDL